MLVAFLLIIKKERKKESLSRQLSKPKHLN